MYWRENDFLSSPLRSSGWSNNQIGMNRLTRENNNQIYSIYTCRRSLSYSDQPAQAQERSRRASSFNMLRKEKRLLVIYGRHDKLGLCFKVLILFPTLGRSIVHYMSFSQEGYFVGECKISYILHNNKT